MHTQTHPLRTAAITAAAIASMALGMPAANASPAPEPTDPPGPVAACPTRIDPVADALRAQGFAAPAAKNFALFITQDCRADS